MPKRKLDDDGALVVDDNEPCTDWSFVLNNYTAEDLVLWERLFEEVSWGLVTKEVAPTTGTPHLQGRVVFRRGYRFSQLVKLGWADDWGKTKCKQDSLYMLKRDSIIFLDKKKNQGKRSDLQRCIDRAVEGASLRQLYTEFGPTMVRYRQGIEAAKSAVVERERLGSFRLVDFPNWEPVEDWSKSVVLSGPPGAGKTEWALAHFNNPMLVSERDQLLEYQPDEHDGIVFDDVDFTQDTREFNITLADQTMPRGVRCRYRTVTIPKGTKKFFVGNTPTLMIDDAAVARRVRHLTVVDRSHILCEK